VVSTLLLIELMTTIEEVDFKRRQQLGKVGARLTGGQHGHYPDHVGCW
jgi:hypothetical protein